MRLTKTKNNNYKDYELISNEFGNEELEVINKLGQLEDLEEELGISIDVFINIVFSTTIIDKDNKIWLVGRVFKNKSGIEVNGFDTEPGPVRFKPFFAKDYGKTWALTREELK